MSAQTQARSLVWGRVIFALLWILPLCILVADFRKPCLTQEGLRTYINMASHSVWSSLQLFLLQIHCNISVDQWSVVSMWKYVTTKSTALHHHREGWLEACVIMMQRCCFGLAWARINGVSASIVHATCERFWVLFSHWALNWISARTWVRCDVYWFGFKYCLLLFL